MLLGLVLHCAANYVQAPLGWAWPFRDPNRSAIFDILIVVIHLFRMPAFFVIAGFFAALLYDRDGPDRFARNRARRVLLPLVLFWPVMMPLVGFGFIFSSRQVNGPSPFDHVQHGPFVRQPMLGHLWFLYYLAIFYAASLVVVPLATRVGARMAALHRLFRTVVTRTAGALVPGVVTALTMLPMDMPGLDTSPAILPAPRVLAAYSVFFAFGWLLHHHRDVIAGLGDRWKGALLAGAAMTLAHLAVLVARPAFSSAFAWHLTAIVLAGPAIWLLIFGITGVFVRYLAQPRPLLRYVSDASYWMYITHLAPAVWIPGLLAHVHAPAVVKFTIVLGATTLLTLVSYHYVVRSTVIGALLNGRRYPRALPVAAAARDGAVV